MPARKYLSCTVPQCANPHYALGYCRGHYMAQRNRAAAAMSTPIVPLRVALAMPAPTIVDLAPMPPAATLPPPPAWRSEGVTPAAPVPLPPIVAITTAADAAAARREHGANVPVGSKVFRLSGSDKNMMSQIDAIMDAYPPLPPPVIPAAPVVK